MLPCAPGRGGSCSARRACARYPVPRWRGVGKGARSRLEGQPATRQPRRCGYVRRKHLRQKGADVATITPDASVKRAADWLRAKNIGALVVTSGNAVLGLISEREIVHAFSRYGETATSMPVNEIMRCGVITVSPDETVDHVMNLMTRHRVRHIPVLREGKLAGIISIGDVVKLAWTIWSLRPTSCAMPTSPRIEVANAARFQRTTPRTAARDDAPAGMACQSQFQFSAAPHTETSRRCCERSGRCCGLRRSCAPDHCLLNP